MVATEKTRVAILASGGGSTAEAFIHATHIGLVNAEVGLVVANNSAAHAGIWQRMAYLNRSYGTTVPIAHISGKTHPTIGTEMAQPGVQTSAESAAIAKCVAATRCSHVLLMGYMKTVKGLLLERYGWQDEYISPYQAHMLNTHPGPLPETIGAYGINASKRVLELGMKHSRHTVHVVAEKVDAGAVITENPVAIMIGDTARDVFEHVQETEKRRLPRDIQDFLTKQALFEQPIV